MERRKILLGSGALLATTLAGCMNTGSDQEGSADDSPNSDGQDNDDDHDNEKDSQNNNKDEKGSDEGDEKTEHDENEEQQEIPGFDREEFEIDSAVIEVKELTYQNHQLDIRVMVSTTDLNILAEEIRALAPGLERAIRDVDVEEFFAEVEQIKFTLYDKNKNTVFAAFLDLEWVREFLDDEITEEEFAERVVNQMEQMEQTEQMD